MSNNNMLSTETSVVKPPTEKLEDTDRLTLDLIKARYETATEALERAKAKQETAEIAYRYFVLQLFQKYGLAQTDAVKETGEIVRGGNIPQA